MRCEKLINSYHQNRVSYLEGMQRSLHEFEMLAKKDPKEARRQARLSLIRSGAFKKNGTPKKNIVTKSVFAYA